MVSLFFTFLIFPTFFPPFSTKSILLQRWEWSFCWKLIVGIPGMRKLLYSPWQTLSIPFALTPIGQLHQWYPGRLPGVFPRQKWGKTPQKYSLGTLPADRRIRYICIYIYIYTYSATIRARVEKSCFWREKTQKARRCNGYPLSVFNKNSTLKDTGRTLNKACKSHMTPQIVPKSWAWNSWLRVPFLTLGPKSGIPRQLRPKAPWRSAFSCVESKDPQAGLDRAICVSVSLIEVMGCVSLL